MEGRYKKDKTESQEGVNSFIKLGYMGIYISDGSKGAQATPPREELD
jgi:hypothetical protein